MEYSLETEFLTDLIPAEKIYWSGQPDPSVIFSESDIFMIPFSLMWGGIAVVCETQHLGLDPPQQEQPWCAVFRRVYGDSFCRYWSLYDFWKVFL